MFVKITSSVTIELPLEMLNHIFCFLDPKSKVMAEQVCRLWNSQMRHEGMWKTLCEERCWTRRWVRSGNDRSETRKNKTETYKELQTWRECAVYSVKLESALKQGGLLTRTPFQEVIEKPLNELVEMGLPNELIKDYETAGIAEECLSKIYAQHFDDVKYFYSFDNIIITKDIYKTLRIWNLQNYFCEATFSKVNENFFELNEHYLIAVKDQVLAARKKTDIRVVCANKEEYVFRVAGAVTSIALQEHVLAINARISSFSEGKNTLYLVDLQNKRSVCFESVSRKRSFVYSREDDMQWEGQILYILRRFNRLSEEDLNSAILEKWDFSTGSAVNEPKPLLISV